MERRSVTNIARSTIAAMMLLTGCETLRRLQARDTEELLTAAGFGKQLVDAEDPKPLEATPPYRLVSRTKDGMVQYTYADPDHCRSSPGPVVEGSLLIVVHRAYFPFGPRGSALAGRQITLWAVSSSKE